MFKLLHSQILKRIPLTDSEFERAKTYFIPMVLLILGGGSFSLDAVL